jgi:hypothetical protein
LDAVGYLDEVHLLRGYGEETDWCLRARSLGWRHMGAPQVFVAHQGGISFGDEKALRVAHNNAILRRRYPDAEARYKTFCLRDPLRPARQRLQRARLEQLRTWVADAQGQAELVIHAGNASQAPLTLSYQHQAQGCVVTLKAMLTPLPLTLDYVLPGDGMQLLADLQSLPLNNLAYEQLTSCPSQLLALAKQLQLPYRILCRDDALLGGDHDWPSFARQACGVELAWATLSERYAQALPGTVLLAPPSRKVVSTAHQKPEVILIADDLRKPEVAERWLALCRQLKRENLPIKLLLTSESPWLQSLQSTGSVFALPTLPGLNLTESLALAGCKAALSLDSNPGSDWDAKARAADHGLSLYAEKSRIATEAGALPLHHLPIPRSQAPHQ